MQSRPSISFSQIPLSYKPDLLPPVGDWKWVASFGHGTEKPVRNPAHQRWIADKSNIHQPAHREVMLTLTEDTHYGYNGKVYRRRPGTIFLFDRYESRDFKAGGCNRKFSCLWLHLMSPHFFSFNTIRRDTTGQVFRDLPNGRIKTGTTPALIMDTWDYCIAHPGELAAWELLKAVIAASCLEILATATPVVPPGHHEQVVQAIQRYIRDHPSEKLTLETLAHMAGYSSFFFHRLFQKHAGQTLKSYVDSIRLEKACELLKQNHTVEHVAEAVGISTASHFGDFFKRHTGFSPKQWLGRET